MQKKTGLFLLLSTLLFQSAGILAEEIEENQFKLISESLEWQRIMRYKNKLFGVESDIDAPFFFFSKNGKTDPESELRAAFEAFEENRYSTDRKMHFTCVYPIRYEFLRRKLGLSEFKNKCQELDEYLENMDADSVSLIFSSYYSGAPASMFGHTFLRLNNKEKSKKTNILNKAIDNAAMTGEDPAFYQVIKGLIGGYQGRYSVWPYYIKAKEYNSSEHRDLYEYELNFSKSEVNQLVLHLWEIASAYSYYYFIQDNCSYRILSLLEFAKPKWKLTTRLLFTTIPIDTVRIVSEQENAIRSVSFRPASSKKFFNHWDTLNSGERVQFGELIEGKLSPGDVDNALLADTANQYFLMKQNEAKGALPERQNEIFKAILLKRSRLGSASDRVVPEIEQNRPDLGHRSSQFLGVLGRYKRSSYFDFSARPALHDLIADDSGYTPHSSLEALELKFRYRADHNKITVQQFKLIDVYSLQPVDSYSINKSYRLGAKFDRLKNTDCESCMVMRATTSPGLSFLFFKSKLLFYTLLEGNLDLSPGLENGWRFGIEPRLGIIFDLTKMVRFHWTSSYTRYFSRELTSEIKNLFAIRVTLGRRWETRFESEFGRGIGATAADNRLSLLYYF